MSAKVGFDDYVAAGAAVADLDRLPRIEMWPTLAPEALYGLAGRVVATIDPFTEADPVATLATFLVTVGNMLGPDVHAAAGEDPHPSRLYAALVGQSSKGRKGMSWRAVRRILAAVDESWAATRVMSGLSTGEGVIFHVRDAQKEQQPIKERGRVVGYETVIADAGVDDKRVCIEEPELAAALRRMERESNSLSAVLRQAWDDGALGTLTRNSPLRATGAHVSILAHITQQELVANLGATEQVNGFANRFLYFLVQRSKELADPERLPDHVLRPLVDELRDVVNWNRRVGAHVLRRDHAAAAAWTKIYGHLSAERAGLLGALTARAEAHVLRMSVLYAILDRAEAIQPPHLAAALAVWGYAETSTTLIFAGLSGHPIADIILRALRTKGEMTRTDIRDLFQRNQSDERIRAALLRLDAEGRIERGQRETGGRPAEVWRIKR